ncbi:hypothetical protein CL658_00995 [bacterium]|nr:hypothetical protein [bacterium]|tara:strand:+ start:347 stop:760 length:414 start_codon:yes stop_codon:yes gene_type:complete
MIVSKSLSLGLTIIELVVVLIISAVLSSIVIPNYTRLQIHAKYSHLKQTAYSIQMAIETFFLYHGTYPNLYAIETLIDLLMDEVFIKQIPINPFTNKPLTNNDSSGKITYIFDASNNRYTIEVYDKKNETILLLLGN